MTALLDGDVWRNMPRKPSEKRREFVAHLAANPDSSMMEAALEAGYSKNTAINARRDILEQPGTLSLIEEFGVTASQVLNNELILNSIKGLLLAEKIDHSHTEPDRVIPDWDARDKGVKHALAVRGLVSNTTNQFNQFNFGGLKDKYNKGGE